MHLIPDEAAIRITCQEAINLIYNYAARGFIRRAEFKFQLI